MYDKLQKIYSKTILIKKKKEFKEKEDTEFI